MKASTVRLPRPAAALALAVLLACTQAQAAERLDDSASPRSRVQAQSVMSNEGRPLADSFNPSSAIVRVGRVDYKLATARYAGRKARIYYVVPGFVAGLRSPAALRVEWRSHGAFAGGAARGGERQLVWTGLVAGPWISESFDLVFQVDLRELRLAGDASFGFESYFEIETFQ